MDTHSPSVNNPEQRRLVEGKRVMLEATNMISRELPKVDDEYPELLNAMSREWKGLLHKALNDAPGSVTQEREDLTDAVTYLAHKTLQREDPRDRTVPGIANILDEQQRDKHVAFEALKKVFERYPSPLGQSDFSKTNIMSTMQRLGQELATAAPSGYIGRSIESLSKEHQREPFEPYKMISNLDVYLEDLCDTLFSSTLQDNVDDFNGHNGDAHQEQHRRDAGKVLPLLRQLMQLRGNLGFQLLGGYKSPDEVRVVEYAREVGSEKKPPTPAVEKVMPLPSFNDVSKLLDDAKITDLVADAKRLITPEIKKVLLANMLEEIDGRIAAAKRTDPERRGLLGCATMGLTIDTFAETKTYHLPLIASEQRVMPGSEVRAMKVKDYLMKVFGYDLSADPARAKELAYRTNMLM